MNEFDTAVNLVRGALEGMKERGAAGRASRKLLDELGAVVKAKAKEGGAARPQAKPVAGSSRVAEAPERPRVAAIGKGPSPAAPAIQTPAAASITIPAKVPGADRAGRLAALLEPVRSCTKCPHLVKSRTQVVVGVGNPDAEVMFVGEAPGEDEDLQGEPFVGKAGQLLTKIIEAMGLKRSDVYIANVLKCRPDMPAGVSGNRKPKAEEMQTCLPYLREQIGIIQPRVLIALGATAMEGLLGETQPMNRLRGRWHSFEGIPLMATYHPAYLLRNQSLSEKRKVWEDMLMVLDALQYPVSEKQRNFFLAKA